VGQHRTHGNSASPAAAALPHAAGLGQCPPSWPVAAISPGARPCPGPSRREQGVPSARSAPTTLRAPGRRRLHRDRPSPATGKARLPRPRRPGGYPQARLPWSVAGADRAPPV